MFDKIFSLPSAVARHKAAPLSEERRRFLAQLDRQGYKPGHLAQTAVDLLRLVPAIQLLADGVHDTAGVEAVIARFVRQRHGRVLPYLRKTLRRLLKQWLRFFGRWKDPTPAAGPLWTLYRDFLNWLEHERGFSVGSLKNRKYSLLTFLRWWEPKNRPLFCLRVVDLDDFLAACHAQGLSRVGVLNVANATRSFLRYAEIRRLCSPGLADAFHGPTIYSHEGLPRGPLWPEVKRLLAALNTGRPSHVRNRAILLLFAVYGFRAGEVARLCLDDIDWRHDRITVPRTKQRRRQTYPLIPSVGRAILRYLKEVRPKTHHREVFLCLLAPVRPISSAALWTVVANPIDRAGIKLLHRGPHCLRHACASRLVSEGFSLPEIGNHLGHRSADATRHYAKVDLPALRDVAAFDLGEVL
jgi:integrase/recombinase XerD